jgi:hypothetical protein
MYLFAGDKVYIKTTKQVGIVVDANINIGGEKHFRIKDIGVVPEKDLSYYKIYNIEETACFPCCWHVMDGTNDNFFRTIEEAMDHIEKRGYLGKIIYKNGDII